MSSLIIDPVRIYEIQGEVRTVLSKNLELAVGTDIELVECVSSERIRVMGWIAQSDAATVGTFQLKSETTGFIMAPVSAPPPTAGLSYNLPIVHSGYMETSTGDGLFADVVTGAVNLTLFYIIYRSAI